MKRVDSDRVVLKQIAYDPVAWDAIVARYPGAEVFHSTAWLNYLAVTQEAEPVVAVVQDAGHPVGYFVGGIVRRYGVRILGSPLRGWGTQCMGFLMEDGADRLAAAEALLPFAFGELGCLHIELSDRHLTAEQMEGSGYVTEVGNSFVLDLELPEDEILSRVRRTTRQEIRKAIRAGLRAEVATDLGFADEFYGYLTAVFAGQGLVPTYPIERVRNLIQTVQPSGQLLLLRIRTPAGATVATGLVVGRNRIAVAWGMAYDRANADFHPIELLWWETMRYWRRRGAVHYDMGGGGDYKAKYGSVGVPTYQFHRSRYRVFRLGRSAIRRIVRARQVVAGRLARPSERPGTA